MQAYNQNFSGQGKFFVEPGHFNKHFVKNTLKKRTHKETFWSIFFIILLKLHFGSKIWPKSGQNKGLFVQKKGYFLMFR